MISVKDAKAIIGDNVLRMQPVLVELPKADNKILAADVYAPFDIPAFSQSSMDGYAFNYSSWQKGGSLRISGMSAAGDNINFNAADKTAVRIFTGAMVPRGADTVVMQEKARVNEDELVIEDTTIDKGNNVRLPGSEIRKGELALSKGSLISPAASGFLAGIGIQEVSVYPNPKIGIILTGNELTKPGETLEQGKVFESNSFALVAALKKADQQHVEIAYAEDDPKLLEHTMRALLSSCDMLLLTGGVSVGEYDFVTQAASACGVTVLFHKVKQRPGKPLFFGMAGTKPVFGLPGNPSSVLTCFYEYVLIALDKLTFRSHHLQTLRVPMKHDYQQKKIPLTVFLKGYYDGREVEALGGQESYKMNSYARANCSIVVDENTDTLKKGGLVEVHLLQ